MTIVKHELKMGKNSFLIWTGAIGFLLSVCVFLFPEMKGQMGDIGDMLGSMGAFTDAFGMDQLNFGTLVGFYAIECGNVLGLGGGFMRRFARLAFFQRRKRTVRQSFFSLTPSAEQEYLPKKLPLS